jgi:hypothetical protein
MAVRGEFNCGRQKCSIATEPTLKLETIGRRSRENRPFEFFSGIGDPANERVEGLGHAIAHAQPLGSIFWLQCFYRGESVN